MNQHFHSLWTALVFGLIWSIVWSLALSNIPFGISGPQAFGGILTLTGAVLMILTALRQGLHWSNILFGFMLLALFGAATVDTTVRIIGSAAVLGWIRTAGRPLKRPILPLSTELLSAAGSLGLAFGFHPTSAMVIGLGIWIFYLLQIIPLAASENTSRPTSPEALHHRFEATRQRVEKILAARL